MDNKDIYYDVWGESSNSLPNFNGTTVAVWELISNIVPHLSVLLGTFNVSFETLCPQV